MANELSANPTTMNFGAGGTIRMSLNVGTMEVVGAQGDRITVSWHSRRPEDESRVSVKVQRSGAKDATVVVDGPGNRVKYRVEVPQQPNVAIHMRAGDLDVHGVLGSVDAELLAGNMVLRVADPGHYHAVSASVTAGEITAQPWHAACGAPSGRPAMAITTCALGCWQASLLSGRNSVGSVQHACSGKNIHEHWISST